MAITKALAEKNGKRLTDVELKALDSESENARGRIWHLFSTKTMAFRTSVICANWLVLWIQNAKLKECVFQYLLYRETFTKCLK